MQGTYIPQYTQVPGTNISVEVGSSCAALTQSGGLKSLINTFIFLLLLLLLIILTVCCFPCFQDSAVQQPVAIETPTEHTSYSYQHNK